MKTERAQFIEESCNRLADSYLEIKFNELDEFELGRARKLIKFCQCICLQFGDDERFSDLFE